MKHLIDKDALIAEIERLEKTNQEYKKTWKWKFKWFYRTVIGRLEVLEGLKNYINSLEVKEVDLEKSLSDLDKDLKEFVATEEFEKDSEIAGRYWTIAKHAFLLGLNARTDKDLVEEVYSHIDSIKDTADRMTSGNFMHHRAAIKLSVNTIANVLGLMGLKPQKGEQYEAAKIIYRVFKTL